MRFTDLQFAALQAAGADPRTSPGTVPDVQIVQLPKTLPNTDTSPPYLGLNGVFTDAPEALADRRFYQVGATVTLTVGTMKTLPAVPGPMYLQNGTAPAAACVLRVAGMAAAIP